MSARFGLPVSLDVAGRRCVVIGGGEQAADRARRLRRADADLLVVTPRPGRRLREVLTAGGELAEREWTPDDLEGATLVIATREDPLDADALWRATRVRHVLCNVLDDVAHCDLSQPALIERGDLQIAVSTGGRAPAVAKAARRFLERVVAPEWGALVEAGDTVRRRVTRGHLDFASWARRWEDGFADVDRLLARLRAGAHDEVVTELEHHVRGAAPDLPAPGQPPTVRLVGAGPGDPGLLTLRAAELLATADVVAHDQLVTDDILALIRPGASVVPVGRRCGRVLVPHEEVVDLLVRAAHQGKRVVRLKGGDPVVFGRGLEEATALAERGVAAELVPGVTSAIAAPELAGIPLTHRGVSSGFLVVTGRNTPGSPAPVDWDTVARFPGTVVILMGVTRYDAIAATLHRHGMAPDLPAAVISAASTSDQRVVRTTLEHLADTATAGDVTPPAVLVLGDVVAQADVPSAGSGRGRTPAAS